MPARIIDGKALSEQFRADIARRVAALREGSGLGARLDAVLVDSGDSAARVYALNQAKGCEALGIEYRLHELKAGSSQDDIAGRVLLLNLNERVSAIMVHMPLPEGVDPYAIQCLIDPAKDVEGVNPANIGNIVYARSSLAPCTALATLAMIESLGTELRGRHAVVVGASNVVGKPIAVLLMRHDATVSSCNRWTPDLPALTRSADVLIAAAGVPDLITGDMVKPGAIVIDVGLSRIAGPDGRMRTVGDVNFEEVVLRAGALSPVPGGVGPVTVAMLLRNVVEAAERRAATR